MQFSFTKTELDAMLEDAMLSATEAVRHELDCANELITRMAKDAAERENEFEEIRRDVGRKTLELSITNGVVSRMESRIRALYAPNATVIGAAPIGFLDGVRTCMTVIVDSDVNVEAGQRVVLR